MVYSICLRVYNNLKTVMEFCQASDAHQALKPYPLDIGCTRKLVELHWQRLLRCQITKGLHLPPSAFAQNLQNAVSSIFAIGKTLNNRFYW